MTARRVPEPSVRIAIGDESDLAVARRQVHEAGMRAALPEAAIAALATAVTEIGRNMIVHARGGEMSFAVAADGTRDGVIVVARDAGPGIPDIGQAMQDGYSTAGSLGIGLSGAQRLVDEFAIESTPGEGVTVTLKQWRPLAL